MDNRTLLIVEDDPGLQSQMRWCVEDCEVLVASTAQEALELLDSGKPEVITLDLGLPPDPGGTSEGFRVLEQALKSNPAIKIIVITGREEKEHALKAIDAGAYDFYQKPIDADTLTFVVERAFRLSALEAENARLNDRVSESELHGLITADPAMQQICRQAVRVAATNATVAILGETGTGKEVIARNIHDLSERAAGPFIAINCAAIPENLLESELFGYEKGAFTGASARRIGKIEAANGGTLFLDEIGDMPASLQSKLLRFLEERSFERLGGNQTIDVDIRVLSATHQELGQSQQSSFRDDLFFRIGEIVINLPPLRDRGTDALLLASHFLKQHADRPLKFSAEACNAIESYDWPGNVRELENRVKRACILCEGKVISAEDLEIQHDDAHIAAPMTMKEAREAAEFAALQTALAHASGNISQAARLLGVSRPTLYTLLSKFELNPEET
jgi:two-component system NtrC family response regulator